MLWQPITIVPGHRYVFEGAYKYIADSAVNVWVEVCLPDQGQADPVKSVPLRMGWSLNTWMLTGVDLVFDGTFQDDFVYTEFKNS